MKSSRNSKRKGFTLVELVVVIVIIGILMAIAVPRLAAYRVMAEHNKVDQIASHLTTATYAYFASDIVQKYLYLSYSLDYADQCSDLLSGYTQGKVNGIMIRPDTGPNGSDIDFQKFMNNALEGSDVKNMSFVPAYNVAPPGVGNFTTMYPPTSYKLANGQVSNSTYSDYNKYFILFKHDFVKNTDEIDIVTQYKDVPGVDIWYVNGIRKP